MSTAQDARFWDRTSRSYAKSRIADAAGYERSLSRTRDLLKRSARVLELGCGTGTTALRHAGGVASYVATDFSPRMIAIAEAKRTESPIPALAFRAATADQLAAEPATFDAVLAFNYLHLVRDVPGTLRHIHALLADDGLFITKTPCLADMNVLLRLAVLPTMRAIGRAPHVSVFGVDELRQLMAEAGFDVLATEHHASKRSDTRHYIVARPR
jgi:ubiquinone/menaquinone biosynthesis C-methylase UbiE